jgi:acetate kinase
VKILVLNGGSSSFKCWYGELDKGAIPEEAPHPEWRAQAGSETDLDALLAKAPCAVDLVGHRIVHGGEHYRQTVRITPAVREAIARASEFAPSHNTAAMRGIDAIDGRFGPTVTQIAVFDTSFHTSLRPAAYVYAGPYSWLERGIRRYGFHGISCQYAARRAAQLLGIPAPRLRAIICHLGGGCSVTAIDNGQSTDTSMGFTPNDGLMMGTRCGAIDSGILLYLLRHCGYTPDDIEEVLNRESGLKGISGISGDMRQIQEAAAGGNERALLAYETFIHRVIREVGAMLGVLGGADALVFTGGIGENCAEVRERVAAQFAWPQWKVLVVPAEEEWEIARECVTAA